MSNDSKDGELRLDLTPRRAEKFPVHFLIEIVDKLLQAGIDPVAIERLAGSGENFESTALLRRISNAWNDKPSLALFTDQKKQWELIYDYYFYQQGKMAREAGILSKAILEPEIYPTEQSIFVGAGISVGFVIYCCRQLFKVTTDGYDDLDRELTNDRNNKTAYGVTVKKIINASEDKRFGGKQPIGELVKTGHKGMTLLERLLMELFHYSVTGQHLDSEEYSFTVCTGSYFHRRGYPRVRWSEHFQELHITAIAPDSVIEGDDNYSREVSEL